MYLISINSLKPNDTLGKAIINDKGQVLLNKGVKLDERYISILKKYGYQFVYIQDNDTSDIDIADDINDELKLQAIKNIKKVFDIVKPDKSDNDSDYNEIVKKIKKGDITAKLAGSPFIKFIESVAIDIINSLSDVNILSGIASLKKQDNFTYQHCLDVTILSIAIANKLLYTKNRLIELAKGCLLHDIGRVLINKSLYVQPRKLTDEEFELVKKHPQIGYLILKDISCIGIIASHIAYQHHEQQDGLGYPRGLKGNNQLPVSDKILNEDYIMPIAEIVSVANVYDALVSPRAYRAAYTPDQAFFVMKRMAGKELNIEAFRVFSDIIPVYPLGTTVCVLSGKYKNFIGVVSKINHEHLMKPIIRLLYNASKKRIMPLEIDLVKNPIINITGMII